jgi:hypothetical protein
MKNKRLAIPNVIDVQFDFLFKYDINNKIDAKIIIIFLIFSKILTFYFHQLVYNSFV